MLFNLRDPFQFRKSTDLEFSMFSVTIMRKIRLTNSMPTAEFSDDVIFGFNWYMDSDDTRSKGKQLATASTEHGEGTATMQDIHEPKYSKKDESDAMVDKVLEDHYRQMTGLLLGIALLKLSATDIEEHRTIRLMERSPILAFVIPRSD